MFDLIPFDSMPLLLMQDGPPPIPGEGTVSATGGGNGAAGEGPAGGVGGGFGAMLPLLLLAFGLMLIFSMLGQRREKKKREAMINSIKKHDKVQTIGGVIGSIVELKPEHVVLKVDESSNTRITFARSAIQQVVKSSGSASASEEGLTATE